VQSTEFCVEVLFWRSHRLGRSICFTAGLCAAAVEPLLISSETYLGAAVLKGCERGVGGGRWTVGGVGCGRWADAGLVRGCG
jgi:hypothetical protein